MRLIDADALIVELEKDEERFDKEADDCRKNSQNYTDCYMQAMSSRADGIRDAIIEIYDAPSINIVFCKECRWRDKGENESCSWSMCTRHIGQYFNVNADDFCSYGERKA